EAGVTTWQSAHDGAAAGRVRNWSWATRGGGGTAGADRWARGEPGWRTGRPVGLCRRPAAHACPDRGGGHDRRRGRLAGLIFMWTGTRVVLGRTGAFHLAECGGRSADKETADQGDGVPPGDAACWVPLVGGAGQPVVTAA